MTIGCGNSISIRWSDVTAISAFSMLCGNTAYCVKLSGDDLSRYSNKIESVGLRIWRYYHYLTKKVMSQYQTFRRACPTSRQEEITSLSAYSGTFFDSHSLAARFFETPYIKESFKTTFRRSSSWRWLYLALPVRFRLQMMDYASTTVITVELCSSVTT